MPSSRPWSLARCVLGAIAAAVSAGCTHPEVTVREAPTSTAARQKDHDEQVAHDVVAIMAGMVFARASKAEQQQFIITVPTEDCGMRLSSLRVVDQRLAG